MNKRFRVLIVVILPIFVATAALGAFYFSTAQADTQVVQTVTTLNDENDGCAVGDCSLREAIAAAGSGDQIAFSVAGTIYLNPALGELFIDKSLTIDGGHAITVSGGFAARVFNISSTVNGIDVNLSNLTIADGQATTGDCGTATGDLCGGGVMVQNELVHLTVNQVVFLQNSAEYGGAIAAEGGDLTIIDSVFDLSYVDFYGAAIYHNYTGTVTIEGSAFYNGYADTDGGAISAAFSSLLITDTLFQQNESLLWGGAIETHRMTAVSIVNSDFVTNTAGSMGGALYLASSPTMISGTLLISNTAMHFGGGAFVELSTIDVYNSDFVRNATYFGGGLSVYSSTTYVSGSIFDSNTARFDGAGGGIYQTDNTNVFAYVFGGPDTLPDHSHRMTDERGRAPNAPNTEGSLTIENSTFANNLSSFGGGVRADYITADVSQNTLFYNNLSFVGSGFSLFFGDGSVRDSIFMNNVTYPGGFGGGLYAAYGGGTFELHNTQVMSNSGGYGGGFYTYDTVAQVSNNVFTGNDASIEGGGIRVGEYVTIDVISTTLENNVAPLGGGMYAYSSTVGVTDSMIQQNSADEAGGGIYYSAYDPTTIIVVPVPRVSQRDAQGDVSNALDTTPSYIVNQPSRSEANGRAVQAIPEMTISNSDFTQNTALFAGGATLIEFAVMTVENGTRFTENSAQDGGAMYGFASDIIVNDAHFTANQAVDAFVGGGAIFGDGFVISDSTFTSNSASFAPIGCGDFCPPQGGGAINNVGPLSLINSLLISNTVTGESNGGGALHAAGPALISGTTFIANQAISDTIGGGAIYALEAFSEVTVDIYNSWFEDNYGPNGGAIYNYNAEVSVHNSGIVNNRAAESGGGLYARSGGAGGGGIDGGATSNATRYVVENSTLSGNTAETVQGGGLYLREGATAHLFNSTVSGNTAAGNAGTAADAGNGGGIYVGVSMTQTNYLILDYVTLTDNEAAGAGGGLDFGRLDSTDQLTITNTILAGNRDTAGYPDCHDNNGTNYTLNLNGYNIVGGTAGDICAAGANDLSLTSLGLTITDVVSALADNSGPLVGTALSTQRTVQTHALPAGSVALDAADPAGCAATDQNGVIRPIDANGDNQVHCDIGAYEAVQSVFSLFMPMFTSHSVGAPDLIVDRVDLTADDVSVTISNIGDGPTMTDFWVDININPDNPPIDVNETWEVQGGEGIVWGITGFSLGVGESLTLNLSSVYYNTEETNFSGRIEIGDILYAQADAANTETAYGNVYETHEIAGGAYNNLFELTAETAVVIE